MNAIDRVQRLLEALKPLEGWPVSVGIWDDRRLDALVIQIELEIGEGRERIRRVLDCCHFHASVLSPDYLVMRELAEMARVAASRVLRLEIPRQRGSLPWMPTLHLHAQMFRDRWALGAPLAAPIAPLAPRNPALPTYRPN